VGALLVTALLGYVGVEAAAIFSEEARVPRRTVPVAVYSSLALIGAAYANAVARYMFALGRERVLPGALGRTEPRTGAPRNASLTQSAVGLAVIVVYALAGWDPMVRLFFWLGTTGAFGVLCLLAVTSIAVVRFFARDPHRENAWRRLVAPTLATLALLAMVWAGLANYPTLLGVAPGSTEAWAFPAAFAVAAVVGVLYGVWLRSARPDAYRRVGLGADALTAG
jgi:amino acid transporter